VGAPAEENLRSGPPGLRLWRPHADRLFYYRPAGRRPHPAPSEKRALPGEESFRTPRSARRPQPLLAIMPSVAGKPSGCRPGARPVEVCPVTCAISSGKLRPRGRERIAGRKSVSERQKSRQSAPCPEASSDFLPSLFDFPLCSRKMLIYRGVRKTRYLKPILRYNRPAFE
jgi:hypothetical protein